MKKLLLGIGLALVFGFAQAQSSVTVYGILDAGYIGSNYKGTGTSTTNKQTTSTFGSSAETPSRLGLRGSEDLGGGTSAFFTVETGLTPTGATASAWNNRQSFVGIKQAGIGEVAVGTQYTPIFKAIIATDPGKANDVIGSVLFPTTPQAWGNSGTSTYAPASSSSGNSDAFTVRTANTLTATTANFNGLVGTAMYTLNNQDSTQTSSTAGGTNNASGYGFGINYTYQKLLLSANYQALKSQQVGTLTSPTPAIWAGSTGGVNTQDNQTYIAGVYDFGILKAYAGWINRKATDTINSDYYASRSAQQVGVRGFWTPVIESWASIGNGKVQAYGQSQATYHFVGYQLGSNYYLSKRTNLYAIFGSNQTSGLDVSANSYALGIKHTF